MTGTTALTTTRPDVHPWLAPLAVALVHCDAAARGAQVFARAIPYGGRTYIAVMELRPILDDPPVPNRDAVLRQPTDAWFGTYPAVPVHSQSSGGNNNMSRSRSSP